MSKFGSTQELYARIGAHLNKLQDGTVQVEDFENLLVDSRELYERALVIRHKAFEKYRSGETIESNLDVIKHEETHKGHEYSTIENANETHEFHIPKDTEELIIPHDEPGFEFVLFGEAEETSIAESKEAESQKSAEREEPVFVHATPEAIIEIAVKVEDKIETTPEPIVIPEVKNTATESLESKLNALSSGNSLLDRLSSTNQSNSLADKLKSSRIESIPSSLTLNDRIRFAKNLFDGNSDTFNASIQLLDAQKSHNDAMELMRQYSERFKWNQDDKVTLDFYDLVERRHA